MNDTFLEYNYQFNFPDKTTLELPLKIEAQSFTLQVNNETVPFWAALDFNQCSNCPLNIAEHPHCPVAKNLIPLLNISATLVSYDAVNVVVRTPARTISADATIQRAISSILGLIMAASPCPHTEYLKPMARFHASLATEEEMIFRAASTYLLAQYFKQRNGQAAEINFNGLRLIGDDLQIVNRALAARFRAATQQDATVNAIILFDLLPRAVNWSVEDQMEEFQPLFERFIND